MQFYGQGGLLRRIGPGQAIGAEGRLAADPVRAAVAPRVDLSMVRANHQYVLGGVEELRDPTDGGVDPGGRQSPFRSARPSQVMAGVVHLVKVDEDEVDVAVLR